MVSNLWNTPVFTPGNMWEDNQGKPVESGQNLMFDHDSSMIFGYLLDSGYEMDDDILLKVTVISPYVDSAPHLLI